MIIAQYFCDLCHVQIRPDQIPFGVPDGVAFQIQRNMGPHPVVREHVCPDCMARLCMAMKPLPKPEVPA